MCYLNPISAINKTLEQVQSQVSEAVSTTVNFAKLSTLNGLAIYFFSWYLGSALATMPLIMLTFGAVILEKKAYAAITALFHYVTKKEMKEETPVKTKTPKPPQNFGVLSHEEFKKELKHQITELMQKNSVPNNVAKAAKGLSKVYTDTTLTGPAGDTLIKALDFLSTPRVEVLRYDKNKDVDNAWKDIPRTTPKNEQLWFIGLSFEEIQKRVATERHKKLFKNVLTEMTKKHQDTQAMKKHVNQYKALSKCLVPPNQKKGNSANQPLLSRVFSTFRKCLSSLMTSNNISAIAIAAATAA
ncbi:hypothetical protein NEPTK9_001554 [Candidatus Neptunochlamydia vexilliferae]|uniref:Uncharacterized protein n=2 Tax=Candidatus Neptunichlamydia vexilliferae TaxID=1651774 RepID=A0ABS0B0V4_9BACT|nr:hypothetical protein [Candidatus Neptunochlamydia vexilliferae]